MIRKQYIVLLITIAIAGSTGTLFPQERVERTAQSILARVDEIMEYPQGLIKGRMKHILPDGNSYSLRFRGYIQKENYLFTFSSRGRGKQLKVLYALRGEDIWVYNIHSLKLFHKMGIDRYDPILASNFSFLDLSNADLQSNYTASIEGTLLLKGYNVYKLKLLPVFRGSRYGMLTLYVTKDKLIPLRIDYHDRDKAIFKFMTISKVKEQGKRIIPIRYEMMNLRQGTVTIISFNSFNEEATFGDSLFRPEKLGGR